MNPITVREWMTADPVTVKSGISLAAARALMQRDEIGRLLVIDEQNRLIGVVAWSDVVAAWPSPFQPLEPFEVRELMARVAVDEVMATEMAVVDPDTTIAEAANLMFEKRVGAVPVVDGGRAVGILTSSDILQGLVRILSHRD
jgi:acetoin utilization protein AcuB